MDFNLHFQCELYEDGEEEKSIPLIEARNMGVDTRLIFELI